MSSSFLLPCQMFLCLTHPEGSTPARPCLTSTLPIVSASPSSALSSLRKVIITESGYLHLTTHSTVCCLHQMATPLPQRIPQKSRRQRGLKPLEEATPGVVRSAETGDPLFPSGRLYFSSVSSVFCSVRRVGSTSNSTSCDTRTSRAPPSLSSASLSDSSTPSVSLSSSYLGKDLQEYSVFIVEANHNPRSSLREVDVDI